MSDTDSLARGDFTSFAAANGWQYLAAATLPASAGAEQLFQGVPRQMIRGNGCEVGRLCGAVTTSTSTHTSLGMPVTSYHQQSIPESAIDIGYLAIRLARRLPHVVLDAAATCSRHCVRRPTDVATPPRAVWASRRRHADT